MSINVRRRHRVDRPDRKQHCLVATHASTKKEIASQIEPRLHLTKDCRMHLFPAYQQVDVDLASSLFVDVVKP
jgi:hypothetical protein